MAIGCLGVELRAECFFSHLAILSRLHATHDPQASGGQVLRLHHVHDQDEWCGHVESNSADVADVVHGNEVQYSVFSNCSSTVTVSPSGPRKLFKGVTTAMSLDMS